MNHLISEWDDLTITPYLASDSLPKLIQDCINLGQTTQEKDIALMSALTAASAVMPNYFFRYGHAAKKYGTNLQTFIMAGAASGKGIASVGLDLVREIHRETPLLIPGDSTYPSFYRQLLAQKGVGYIHESEGSVITDIWGHAAMTYNTALRKAAEHEPISQGRVASGATEIENPHLSCLLTGTFGQFQKLVPSVENGFFSRLTMFVVRGRSPFDPSVFKPNGLSASDPNASSVSTPNTPLPLTKCTGKGCLEEAGKGLLSLYHLLASRKSELEFRLTDEQASLVGTWFEREYGVLTRTLGENFHPTIIRMGITTMRIAAILTAIRLFSPENTPLPLASEARVLGKGCLEEAGKGLVFCSDLDFQSAMLIAGKLILHAADAYNQIEGKRHEAVPSARGNYQKAMLFEALPTEFSRKEGVTVGQQHGVPMRTLDRWLSEWCNDGSIGQTRFGCYQKMSA